jgi:hypothetical protein
MRNDSELSCLGWLGQWLYRAGNGDPGTAGLAGINRPRESGNGEPRTSGGSRHAVQRLGKGDPVLFLPRATRALFPVKGKYDSELPWSLFMDRWFATIASATALREKAIVTSTFDLVSAVVTAISWEAEDSSEMEFKSGFQAKVGG